MSESPKARPIFRVMAGFMVFAMILLVVIAAIDTIQGKWMDALKGWGVVLGGGVWLFLLMYNVAKHGDDGGMVKKFETESDDDDDNGDRNTDDPPPQATDASPDLRD